MLTSSCCNQDDSITLENGWCLAVDGIETEGVGVCLSPLIKKVHEAVMVHVGPTYHASTSCSYHHLLLPGVGVHYVF